MITISKHFFKSPFSEIRAFINSKMDLSRQAIWVGYTDVDREGQWKLVDGELYDAGDRSQESLYYWMNGQPNNYRGSEDCANVWLYNGQASLNDIGCFKNAHSSWKFYGLCEVCLAWRTKSETFVVCRVF